MSPFHDLNNNGTHMTFNYDLTDAIKLRRGAGYSIARPTYRQLARHTEFELNLAPDADYGPAR